MHRRGPRRATGGGSLPARPLSTIGAAVIGSGFIGTVHIEALRRIGVQVKGLLETTPELGAERAAQLGLPRAYASLDELLADEGVDVVHVTSPNHLHSSTQRDPRRRPHVVCEKPLAMNAADGRAVGRRRAAAHRGRNFNSASIRITSTLRERDRAGEIWATSGWSAGTTSRTGCSTTPTGTGASSPSRAAACAPWATSARTGSTLPRSSTGRRVDARDGRPGHLRAIRQEPAGTSRPSRPSVRRDTVTARHETEDAARSCLRFEGGARGVSPSARSAPGARTSSTRRSMARRGARRGTRSSRTTCGSATAGGPTSRSARPGAMNEAGRAARPARRPRGGFRRHVPRALSRRVQRGCGGALRAARPTRRSPTATRSAGRRRDRPAARPKRWMEVLRDMPPATGPPTPDAGNARLGFLTAPFPTRPHRRCRLGRGHRL